MPRRFIHVISLVLLINFSGDCQANDPKVKRFTAKGNRFEHKSFRIRIVPRSPNQIAAFYEARGFPQFALDEVRKVCFITTILHNSSNTQLYHDLDHWHFSDRDGPLKRILRPEWIKRWQDLGLAKRFQSTFRWTLMPEKLDFYPEEGEGGNLIFPRKGTPITITAAFSTGKGENVKYYEVVFKDIKCATDTGNRTGEK